MDFSDLGGKPINAPIDFSDLGGKPVDNGPDWGGIVKDALNEARMGNGSKMKALMTDPVTQAKVLPILAGTAGAVTGIPMGATLGTVGGRQLSNLALKVYGKGDQIPSTGDQIKEGVISGALDLTAIPAINRKIFGGQIGAAEEAAGVPAPSDIPSLPRPKAGEPVSGGIDQAIESVRSAKASDAVAPTYWKQIKDQIDNFYNLGKDAKLTNLDKAKLQWLSGQVQEGLNLSVPGRAAPAASLAMSQTVPNAIGSTMRSIPWWAKGAASVVGGDALVKALGNMSGRAK